MKLLFIWVKKYQHLQFSEPFLLSPEYDINFSRQKCSIQVTKNQNYLPNFYGKNISEVTAMVGANGSGKTTTALMLMKYCESIQAITEKNMSTDKEFVQVYKEGNELWIYYYLSGDILKCEQNTQVTKCYDVSQLNEYTKHGYYEEVKQHNLTSIYISNVFNPDDLTGRSHMYNSAVGDTNTSLCYTPSFCLRLSRLRTKNQYGQNVNNLIMSVISQYAERMSNDSLRDFDDYQGELFIRAYKNIPESVKQKLPIFNNYFIGIHQFGSYMLLRDTSKESLKTFDDFDQTVVNIQKKFFKFNIPNQPLFLQCFINILCEAELFFGYIKSEELQIEPKRSKIGIEIDKFVNANKCILDINLLEIIRDTLTDWRNEDFRNLDWYKQLVDSIGVFKKHIDDNFKVGYANFGDSDYILNFYLQELEKPVSFFHKYILFTPVSASSGELALANTFAYIHDSLTQKSADNVLLVFDEIDATLHPRWQQSILKNLLECIQMLYNKKNFQIVFTTHSPIILSDLTADRVVKLARNYEDKNKIMISRCKKPVLGANIERLFYDGFFMNEGSIGEIAKEKITKVLRYIKGEDKISKEEVDYIISSIGEPVVQSRLRTKVDEMSADETIIEELRQKIQEVGPKQALKIISQGIGGGK